MLPWAGSVGHADDLAQGGALKEAGVGFLPVVLEDQESAVDEDVQVPDMVGERPELA